MKSCNHAGRKPSFKERKQSNGYIFFSLSRAPEYHASQVANAVKVARYVGAHLTIPDIIGHKLLFEEIYDVESFVASLKGVVKIDKNPPVELPTVKLPDVALPNGASMNFVASKINPIICSKRSLKIITYFNTSKAEKSSAYECIAMFESLKLQPDLQQLVDSMVRTLRSISQKIHGHYTAVDLRVGTVKRKICEVNKHCYSTEEIGKFLTRIGVERETSIYVTQTGWSSSLDGLRNAFPNTFTKDAIMAADQRATFMEYKKIIDFYICTKSDVFVTTVSGRFYGGVVRRRINEGRTQVLVRGNKTPSAPTDYVSPSIAKRTHSVYSCFC